MVWDVASRGPNGWVIDAGGGAVGTQSGADGGWADGRWGWGRTDAGRVGGGRWGRGRRGAAYVRGWLRVCGVGW